jgi:uncharacterized protein YndB with AHSA1/START domain
MKEFCMTRSEKVDFTSLMRVSPDKAYEAMTAAEGLEGWFTKGAEVEAKYSF